MKIYYLLPFLFLLTVCNKPKQNIELDFDSLSSIRQIIDLNEVDCELKKTKESIIINSNEIKNYYSCDSFIYLIQGGWKGKTYGVLILKDTLFELPKLCFDYEEVDFKIKPNTRTYYCSSKIL